MAYDFELPSEEDLKKIYADIDASKESIEMGVEYLIQWMKQQPHLPAIEDKEFMTNFLVGCKNSLEKAKKRINSYYITKAQLPEIYTKRDTRAAEFKKCMNTMFIVPLPRLTADCYRIVINGYGVHKKDEIPSANDVMRLYSSVMDINIKFDRPRGYISIYDFANFSSSLHKLSLSSWTTSLQILKNGVPVRLHKIYVLNLPSTFQYLLNCCLNLWGQKMSSRVIVWRKDPKDLVEIFPKDILPSDYGGTERSIAELRENSIARLIHHRDWLLATDVDKADLRKVPDIPSSDNLISAYGMQGSFRKLSFD